ncbi:FkbM family methyltransferase [Limnospira platensis CENA597]|uniref:FkbM family methyltransferase n=1 Tax=Limnospira platensis TaxID=118562 RepID=UPI003D9FFB59
MQNSNSYQEKAGKNVNFNHENLITFSYKDNEIKFLEDDQDWIPKLIKEKAQFYELDLLEKIQEYLVPGDLVIDAGANIGNHSVYFAKVCGCKVFAFEPINANFVKLQNNISINRITHLVECFNLALGANEGRGNFVLPSSSNLGSYRVIDVKSDHNGNIPVSSLDLVNLSLKNQKIKFIKLDIEGMEYDAIKGALSIIENHKPLLSIEIKNSKEFFKIYDLLLPLKYSVIGTFNATPTFLFAAEENGGNADALRRSIRELSIYYIQSKTQRSETEGKAASPPSISVLTQDNQEQKFTCPLCKYYGVFHDFGFKKRKNALCPNCGSLERTRLLFLFMNKQLDIFKNSMKLIHFAPEKSLYNIFSSKLGSLYTPVDFDVTLYETKGMEVGQVDMCSDLSKVNLHSFDVILHMHVLEHIKCDYKKALKNMHEAMKLGGFHIIAVPFGGKKTIENLSPNLTPEERIRKFGHPDNMRTFGEEDFVEVLRQVSGLENVECDYYKFLSKGDIIKYSLGQDATGNIPRWNRLFAYQKI